MNLHLLLVTFIRTNITGNTEYFMNRKPENELDLSYLWFNRDERVTSDDENTMDTVLEGRQPVVFLVTKVRGIVELTIFKRSVANLITDSKLERQA